MKIMQERLEKISSLSLFIDKIRLAGIIFFTGIPTSRAVATPVKGGDAMEMVYCIIMLYILLEILRTIKK